MSPQTDSESFVLLRLAERRFAVAAGDIAELVAPSRVFCLPHHTKEIEGVLLRRARVFELTLAEMVPPSEADLPHVSGWLSHAGDVIEVLNLNALTPGPIAANLLAPVAALHQEVLS